MKNENESGDVAGDDDIGHKPKQTKTLAKNANPVLDHYDDAKLYEYEYRRRRDDVNYYTALALGELPPSSTILELCCGSGRITRSLLRSGFHVTGLDNSAPMLEHARESIARLPKRFRSHATIQNADVRRFDLGRRFPMVIMAFNSFEHLYSREDIEACLRNIKAHLTPEGLFAFDVQLPDLAWLLKDPDKHWARTKFRHPVTGQQLAYSTNHIYDHVKQTVDIRIYYEPLEPGPLNNMIVTRLQQRRFFPEELRALLHYSEFQVCSHNADFSGDPLDKFAESQVLLCRPY